MMDPIGYVIIKAIELDTLRSRLALAEKVANEAKMAVIGYPRYEMRPLRDALAKLKEGETE